MHLEQNNEPYMGERDQPHNAPIELPNGFQRKGNVAIKPVEFNGQTYLVRISLSDPITPAQQEKLDHFNKEVCEKMVAISANLGLGKVESANSNHEAKHILKAVRFSMEPSKESKDRVEFKAHEVYEGKGGKEKISKEINEDYYKKKLKEADTVYNKVLTSFSKDRKEAIFNQNKFNSENLQVFKSLNASYAANRTSSSQGLAQPYPSVEISVKPFSPSAGSSSSSPSFSSSSLPVNQVIEPVQSQPNPIKDAALFLHRKINVKGFPNPNAAIVSEKAKKLNENVFESGKHIELKDFYNALVHLGKHGDINQTLESNNGSPSIREILEIMATKEALQKIPDGELQAQVAKSINSILGKPIAEISIEGNLGVLLSQLKAANAHRSMVFLGDSEITFADFYAALNKYKNSRDPNEMMTLTNYNAITIGAVIEKMHDTGVEAIFDRELNSMIKENLNPIYREIKSRDIGPVDEEVEAEVAGAEEGEAVEAEALLDATTSSAAQAPSPLTAATTAATAGATAPSRPIGSSSQAEQTQEQRNKDLLDVIIKKLGKDQPIEESRPSKRILSTFRGEKVSKKDELPNLNEIISKNPPITVNDFYDALMICQRFDGVGYYSDVYLSDGSKKNLWVDFLIKGVPIRTIMSEMFKNGLQYLPNESKPEVEAFLKTTLVQPKPRN